MFVLWVVVLGVWVDVAHCMEGPRGKVTRQMCSKPASQVPEEHWPYCCEGYGTLCEDFAASCYLNCQPVVSSGNDVTLVEERPGFCCALYNFCCAREFSRIGDLQKVQVEERFPIFHRFHGPGRQAPSRRPTPRKNIVKQDIKNDISEIPNTVNRIGRTRLPSRNIEPQVKLERFESKSARSLLHEVADNLSLGVSRPEQQQNRFNSKTNVVKPQRSQVRFPLRPQNDKTKENNTPTRPEGPASNFGQLKANNQPSIQSDSFRKIVPNKKTEISAKSTENIEERKNIKQNNQQLNREAENREITLNRAGVTQKLNREAENHEITLNHAGVTQQLNREAENRKFTLNRAGVSRLEKQSKTNPIVEAANDDNQEKLAPRKQFKRVSIPIITKNLPEIKTDNNSEDNQVNEEKSPRVTTEEPTTARSNNGRKIKIGRRVLVRTAPKKINNNEQETLKSIDSVQNNQEIKPIASRRTITGSVQNNQKVKQIASRRTFTDSVQNNQEVKPIANRRTITDSVQNNKEVKPIASRRTITDSVQNNQKVKPIASRRTITDSVQNNQEVKPIASRRTIISNRQTGSRRPRPNVANTKESTTLETNQEESNASQRTVDRNRERRIKQTVRRVSPDRTTQQESVKLATNTIKEQQEVPSTRRTRISNKPVVEKSVDVALDLEKQSLKLKAPTNSQPDIISDVLTEPLNTVEITTLPPLSKEETEEPKLDLDSSATEISEDKSVDQNNLKNSKQEKTKEKTVTGYLPLPQEINEKPVVTEIPEKNQNRLEITKVNKVNENQEDNENSSSNRNTPRQGRTRSRNTIPAAFSSSRNEAASVTGENSAITSSRPRSRIRSSRTRNQESIPQEETPTSTSANGGTARSGRAESFGRKDVSKTPVQNVPKNSENTARRITRRRGRQPT